MQQQIVIKANTAPDLLKMVPHLVGVPAEQSLVLVAFRGKRTAGAMRIDLPRPDLTGKRLKRWCTTAVGLICKVERIDGVLAVVYTDATFATDRDLPFAGLLEAVRDRAEQAGLEVKDALCVAADGWGSLEDPMLPPTGRPLAEIDEGLADLPARDDVLREVFDVEAAVAPLPVDPADVAPFAAALERWTGLSARAISAARQQRLGLDRPAPRGGRALPDALRPENASGREYGSSLIGRMLRGQQDPAERVERAIDGRDGVEGLALLAAMADLPVLRDLVTTQIGWGEAFGHHAYDRTVVRGHEPLRADDPVALVFTGGDFARPDVGRVERGIALLRLAAAHTPERERPPLLTMIAWLHWTLGRGSVAGRFAVLARTVSPRYGLAEIVHTMVANAVLPEWAFHQVPLGGPGLAWMLPDPTAATA